jgi:hypothetical protein
MRKRSQLIQRQFIVLYRVFLLRVVDLEILSADGDVTKLLGQFAALLAGVSVLFTAPLILVGGRLDQETLWTMEHLLIATTMVMVGLFSVFNWDSIFPDRKDVLILAPLPVGPSTLFVAKLGALISAVFVAILAMNVFTGLIWPILFSPQYGGLLGIGRSFLAYWMSLLVAGLFVFCIVLGVQGTASHLLPRQLFLRLSAFLQVTAFTLLLGMYILEPSLEAKASLTAAENQHLLEFLPSYWFLGLFQQLNGSMSPEFAPLAKRAWEGSGIAIVVAVALVTISYLHTLRKTVEEPDILPSSVHFRTVSNLGRPLQSAVFFFTLRTLLRSRHHRVILSFYLGVAFAVVIAYVQAPFHRLRSADAQESVPFLVASILMTAITIAAIRVVVAMPITARANWIFRITELRPVPKYVAAVRNTMLLLTVLPACTVSTACLAYEFSPYLAAKHLVMLSLFGALLVEMSVYGFQKIPFTCSYLPGKGNLQYVFWISAFLALPLVGAAARLEARTFNNPLGYWGMTLILIFALVYLSRRVRQEAALTANVRFEEAYVPEINALSLHSE